MDLSSEWLALVGTLVAGAVLSVLAQSLIGSSFDRLLFRIQARFDIGRSRHKSLSGIWHGRYKYPSSESESILVDEYFIVLRDHRGGVSGKSLPRPEGSILTLALELEGAVVTGTWRESTVSSQRTYHGTCQLMLNSTGDALEGEWTGYSRDNTIQHGPWKLQRVAHGVGRKDRHPYETRGDLAWHQPTDCEGG
jgi:hypothetical protein